jgi:Predicted nucleotide-binding protein containing TIR-like domain
MKPTLFVASSTESLPLAYGIQTNLQHDADVTVWNQGVITLGSMTLDALIENAAEYDFGVFIFSNDDLMRFRQKDFAIVRDNVLFEFGAFIAKLGRKRVFMLFPQHSDIPLHLPSDLAGLTGSTYDLVRIENGDNIQAVLGPACQSIRDAIAREWKEPADFTRDLVLLLRCLDRDNTPVPPEQYAKDIALLSGAPEEADEHLGRAWRRAARYQMLLLHREGLVETSGSTKILYKITKKGRRILGLLKGKGDHRVIFERVLQPFTFEVGNWGMGKVVPKPQLSGNDYRLLFAVYEMPGSSMAVYESAIKAPATSSLPERAKRLEVMGLLHVFASSDELDITPQGRDLVGPIKAVADQVYGRRRD